MKWPDLFKPRRVLGDYDPLNDPTIEQTFYILAARKRRDVGRDTQARLYLHDGKRLIVTAVAGISDTGPVAILDIGSPDREIGACVREHLLRFSPDSPSDMRDHKAADWAAFKASKERSVKGFEERCFMVIVQGGSSSATIDAFPRKGLHPGFSVHATERYDETELGAAIRRTLAGAQALRNAGVL